MAYVPPNLDAPTVPRACYRVWLQAVDHKPSKAGNPMSTLSLQILSPEKVTLRDGTTVNVAGQVGKMWIAFSEAALPYSLRALAKIGIAGPKDAESEADYIAKIQEQLTASVGQTFEMVVSSEKGVMKGADGQPLKDSNGVDIQSPERADFQSSNIVGNLIPLSALGGSNAPY